MAQTDAVRQSGTGARARHRMLVGPIIGPPKLRFFLHLFAFFLFYLQNEVAGFQGEN